MGSKWPQMASNISELSGQPSSGNLGPTGYNGGNVIFLCPLQSQQDDNSSGRKTLNIFTFFVCEAGQNMRLPLKVWHMLAIQTIKGPIGAWMAPNHVQWDIVWPYCTVGGLWGPFGPIQSDLGPKARYCSLLWAYFSPFCYPKGPEWP